MKTLIGCFLLASLALAFTAKADYDAYKVEQAQQEQHLRVLQQNTKTLMESVASL